MRLRFLSLILVFSAGVFISAIALAQETALSVRGGVHDEYARLVFDWDAPAQYSLSREGTELKIAFSRSAALDEAELAALDVPNIKAIQITQTAPSLSLALEIPDNSDVREMTIGDRVIIDIYNPPGGAVKTEIEVASAKPAEASAEEEAQEPEAAPEKKAETEAAPETEASVLPPSEEALAPPPSQPETTTLKASNRPVFVVLSSTQSMGVAAFEKDGALYVANDNANVLLQPQVSGPNAESFQPIQTRTADIGQVYELPLPPGNIIKGHGGGLVWRLIIASDQRPGEPVEPVRVGVERGEARSGYLLWPFQNARNIVTMDDPNGGLPLKIITVEKAEQASITPRSFVDFDVLPSPIGLVIAPKVEDLNIKLTREGVRIGRDAGLSLSESALIDATKEKTDFIPKQAGQTQQRLFDFENWQLGDAQMVDDNRTILLESLKDLSDAGRVENLVSLAKMYLSHGMGAEALGALRFAQIESPNLSESPEFKALRGVAEVLAHSYEYAFEDLSPEALKNFEESAYWRAAALAGLGDWQQAEKELPSSVGFVAQYPPAVRNRIVPPLAEIALRAGNVSLGERFLDLIRDDPSLNEGQKAALDYLEGEAARQKGDLETTKKLWEPLTVGADDLYRAKAGLALTRLMVDNKELSPGKAIDRLERLRYAWRGDELEAQINMWLGRTYFESGEYVRGLQIMREATTFVPGTQLAQRIAAEMSDTFTNLFLSPELDRVSPLDAVALYNEFIELVPVDERGDQLIEKLAEHLVKADLLARAGNLLDYLIQHRLEGEHAYRVSTRLAAIRLLDGEPKKAQAVIEKAEKAYAALPEEMQTRTRSDAVMLLKARTLSQMGRPDQALKLLRDMDQTMDVNRLRADIAWQANYWDDAADALEDVIIDENIILTRPLKERETSLLLRRAIALNLSSDRIALANMRERYTDLMNQTDKGKIFEVITRPRKSAGLADRDTLMGIVSETDLFSDFLNSYKSMQNPVN